VPGGPAVGDLGDDLADVVRDGPLQDALEESADRAEGQFGQRPVRVLGEDEGPADLDEAAAAAQDAPEVRPLGERQAER
jgi:hypothetical protein